MCFLIEHSLQTGTYECTYISGTQIITRDELTEAQVNQCGITYEDTCTCEAIPTKCTFEPDHAGELIIDQVVPDSTADGCDPEFCICTSHNNYHQIVAERISSA